MISQYIKLSDLLKDTRLSPFLVGAFLSRIMEENVENVSYFYAYSTFRTSKYIHYNEFNFKNYVDQYINKLDDLSGYKNWTKHSVSDNRIEVRFYVKNDCQDKLYDKNQFYYFLRQKAHLIEPGNFVNMTEPAKSFLRGFLELRGSVDTEARFLADDFFVETNTASNLELKKALILVDLMNVPCEYLNFNPRQLQPQYVSGENKRNPQLRINLFYYAAKIGFINDYKALIFERAYSAYIHGKHCENQITYYQVEVPNRRSDDVTFAKRLNFFSNYLYKQTINENLVKKLRKEMGIENERSETREVRDRVLVELCRETREDKCAVCGTAQTITNRNTGRQQFHIHHVISFKNGGTDCLANLVKVCPDCHEMLKKNVGLREDQIRANIKILHDFPDTYEFAVSYFGEEDINKLAELICDTAG